MRRVREEQGAQRQLTSSKGPERMGIHHHEEGTAFTGKGILFISFHTLNKNAPTRNCLCLQNKKNSLCRLKIKYASRSKSCVYSWCTSPHGSEQVDQEATFIGIMLPPPPTL